jgi:hypothetical protein
MMQNLYIKQTRKTPEITFSPSENIFLIRGNSSPEDVRAMYYPVIDWIKIFVDDVLFGDYPQYTPENPITFKIDLNYFNSSSAKFLYDILSELKRLPENNIKTVVDWYYDIDDNDHKEAGNDLATLAEMEFTFVPRGENQL